jgi:hypothetical protein
MRRGGVEDWFVNLSNHHDMVGYSDQVIAACSAILMFGYPLLASSGSFCAFCSWQNFFSPKAMESLNHHRLI